MTPDLLLQRADTLVWAAAALGEKSCKENRDTSPILSEIDAEQWVWVFTIAATFIAMTRLNQREISERQRHKVARIVRERLNSWKPDGVAGFEDCKAAFEKAYAQFAELEEYKRDDTFLGADALSTWMMFNLLKRPPLGDSYLRFAREIGVGVTHAFFEWWE